MSACAVTGNRTMVIGGHTPHLVFGGVPMRHAVCRAGNPTRTTSAGSSRKGSPAEVIVKVLCRGLGEIYSSLRSLYINTRILIRVLQYRKWTSGIRCPESTHFYCAEKIGASGIAIPEVQFWYQDSRTTHGEAAESILEMNFRLGIGIPVSGSVVRTLHCSMPADCPVLSPPSATLAPNPYQTTTLRPEAH